MLQGVGNDRQAYLGRKLPLAFVERHEFSASGLQGSCNVENVQGSCPDSASASGGEKFGSMKDLDKVVLGQLQAFAGQVGSN